MCHEQEIKYVKYLACHLPEILLSQIVDLGIISKETRPLPTTPSRKNHKVNAQIPPTADRNDVGQERKGAVL